MSENKAGTLPGGKDLVDVKLTQALKSSRPDVEANLARLEALEKDLAMKKKEGLLPGNDAKPKNSPKNGQKDETVIVPGAEFHAEYFSALQKGYKLALEKYECMLVDLARVATLGIYNTKKKDRATHWKPSSIKDMLPVMLAITGPTHEGMEAGLGELFKVMMEEEGKIGGTFKRVQKETDWLKETVKPDLERQVEMDERARVLH
ncbi:MAG: hypothetical protein Q9218_003811 [Villophora microphyllina]